MRFVTRKNAAVDRIACPWLIRRFIDKDAEFLYVDPADVARVARETDAIPYDVDGVELGHVDGRCSFASILLKYGLDDPALARMAKIVHAADVEAVKEYPVEEEDRPWRRRLERRVDGLVGPDVKYRSSELLARPQRLEQEAAQGRVVAGVAVETFGRLASAGVALGLGTVERVDG